MKKVLFVLVAIGGVSLSSCKKDYTCECTTKSGSASVTSQTTYLGVSKSAAKGNCVSTKDYKVDGTAVPDYSQTCNLK